MRKYELTLILKPDLKKEEQEKILKELKKIVEKKGEVGKTDLWGKRTLAYKIENQTHGIYYLMNLKAEPEVLAKLEEKMRLEENIIRYLIVKI